MEKYLREQGIECLKSETEAHQWHNGSLCLGEQGTCRESWWQCSNVTKPGSSSGNQRRGTLATKHIVIRSASLLLPGWGSELYCFLSVGVYRSWQCRQILAVTLGRVNIWLHHADDMGPLECHKVTCDDCMTAWQGLTSRCKMMPLRRLENCTITALSFHPSLLWMTGATCNKLKGATCNENDWIWVIKNVEYLTWASILCYFYFIKISKIHSCFKMSSTGLFHLTNLQLLFISFFVWF